MEPRSEVPPPKSSSLNSQTINQLIKADLEKYSFLESRDDNDESIISIRRELSQTYQDLAQFVVDTNNAKGRRGFLFIRWTDKKSSANNENLVNFVNHWKNFANNVDVQETFGRDKLNIAEEKLSRDFLEKALSPDGQQREAMDELNNSIVAPFVILNKYNPFNFYGEKDFGFKKTKEYLSGFSQERLSKLEDSTVPGLKEIIKAQEPSGFRTQVTRMAVHFLQSGSLQEKLYIARDTSAKIMSQETRGQIQEVLEAPNTPEAVRLEFFTSKISKDRATTNSLALDMLFSYLTRNGNPQLLSLLKFNEGRVLDGYINKQELTPQDIKSLARVLGTAEDQTQNAILFAKDQKKINPELKFTHHERSTEGTLAKLITLSRNKDLRPLLTSLYEYGFRFNSYQTLDPELFNRMLRQKDSLIPFIRRLHELGYDFSDIDELQNIEQIEDREGLISALSDIRKYDPEFRYYIFGHNDSDPYRQFITRLDNSDGFSYGSLVAIKKDKGSLPSTFSDPLLEIFRSKLLYSKDESLRRKYLDQKKEPSPEEKVAFREDINKVLDYVEKHPDLDWFYSDNTFSSTLTIRPQEAEKMASLPERFPELISLMAEGGPLRTNIENVLSAIFTSQDFDIQAEEIVSVFTKKQPYWEMLYFYTEKRLKNALLRADSAYPVKDRQGKTRPFHSLNDEEKLLVFKEYLKTIIESSRSEVSKKEADEKNRKFLEEKLTLAEGDYIHGTAIDSISQILLNGNLCGEALGAHSIVDSRPFHVDCGRITNVRSNDVDRIIGRSISAGYGTEGRHGREGQMFLVMKRTGSNYEKGVDYQVGPGYALMFVGIPSTAIDAIVLRNPSVGLEPLKHEIVENGFYLPIYDLRGNLVFTPNDYGKINEDENIARTPVETWDYSLKSGGQKGSNPAAEFTIPEEDGPAKYYVKFKTLESEDQIWNELLANLIYRTVGISVPATKVVRVNGVYGHASKIVDNSVDGRAQSQDWKKGYLADCLLANWDILSALEQNTVTVSQTGEVFRIDNGGALLYRARGERKSEKDLGGEVNELEEASTVSPRKMGISDESLRLQAQSIKEKLTDGTIDRLVDSVRLKTQDREYLKQVLKKRRDFIVNRFLT